MNRRKVVRKVFAAASILTGIVILAVPFYWHFKGAWETEKLMQEFEQEIIADEETEESEKAQKGEAVYKDVCNPITAQFREELYTNILDTYEKTAAHEAESAQKYESRQQNAGDSPAFSVTVTPFERDGSNICGLARIYFEDSFIVNNVNIVQGREKLFVSMPSYKTKQTNEQGKAVYQDVCYPVTKEFREKLYAELIGQYEQEKEKAREQARNNAQKQVESPAKEQEKEELPFR